jgi:hypothetical protein
MGLGQGCVDVGVKKRVGGVQGSATKRSDEWQLKSN